MYRSGFLWALSGWPGLFSLVFIASKYRIKVWQQLKQEGQAIEEKYEAKMKQLVAEKQAHQDHALRA